VPTGRRKPAIEADGGRASAGYPSAVGDHRKKNWKAQGETDSRHVQGGTLWAEPATGVSVSGAGPEHAALPESPSRQPGAPGEDARNR
jgi:hypothetical protein